MRTQLTSLIGLFICSLAMGQSKDLIDKRPVHEISLDQALHLALEKNFLLRIDRLEREISDQELRAEQGAYDPRLELSYFDNEVIRQLAFNPDIGARPPAYEYHSQTVSAGISGQLPLGAQYTISAESAAEQVSNNGFDNEVSTDISVSVSQPLLRGAFQANLLPLRIARKGIVASEAELRAEVINTIAQVYATYNDLYSYQKSVEVGTRSRDLALRLLEDNRKRVDIGSMAPIDLVLTESEVALREERMLLLRNYFYAYEQQLKQLIASEDDALTGYQLKLSAPPQAQLEEMDLEVSIETAFETHPDILASIAYLEQARMRHQYQRNSALPGLSLVASYGVNGLDNSRRQSWEQARTMDNDAVTLGLVLELPFPNREAKAYRQIAKIRENQAELRLERTKQNFKIRVENAINLVNNARWRMTAAQRSRDLAEQALQAEEKKLKAGTSQTYFVIQAQSDLAEAETQLVEALTEWNKAVSQYYQSLGLTLDQLGLDLI